MRVLVVGWFSFDGMGATAGDLLTRDVACRWLRAGGVPFDVAVASPFDDGIRLELCEPRRYSVVLFVCGPFGNGPPITEFLRRFDHCHLFGLNLSMLESLTYWDPFEVLLERDSNRGSRPDLAFLSDSPAVPVVGSVLVHPQREYGSRGLHARANGALAQLLSRRKVARVPIDTRLDTNETGLRTPAEVESLLARMDVIVTTRLHGLVLGIKNGVPVLAIDPIAGGAKLQRQAQTIGWPALFTADALDDDDLDTAFAYCLTSAAREQALASRRSAEAQLSDVRDRLMQALSRTMLCR